ncbi:MAG: (Na+)-NQR maturation NqrM [Proteobacteria bacterium]|nr:(Na+)-NQR maturation NqrM [Pseudomonadota bacterium]
MTLFLITFAFIAVVITMMAIGVIFGRQAIKGSCGGSGGAACVCTEKCDKRKKLEAAQSLDLIR